MSVLLGSDPLPLFVTTGALAASATRQNNKTCVLGYRRVFGSIFSSVAAAAGYPRVRQSMDGTNFDISTVATLSGTQTQFLYNVDVPIVAPYVSVEIQDAGAGSTVRSAVYADMQVGSGGSLSGASSPPTWSTESTYTSTFAGLAAPIGQFFELRGTAGVVGRVKEIYIFKPSAATTLTFLLQSTASTGGTGSTVVTPMDTTNVTASLVSRQYTAAPTAGTSAGNILQVSSVTAGDIVGWTFGDDWDQPIVVRASQSLALQTSAAFTCYGYVRWVEAAS